MTIAASNRVAGRAKRLSASPEVRERLLTIEGRIIDHGRSVRNVSPTPGDRRP